MRGRLFTLMSLACSLALAATVYKWVDENGIVHYSDQPHANAQKVQVESAQTYRAADSAVSPPAGPSAPPGAAVQPPSYRGCAIEQPVNDQTYANIDSLTFVVRTDPSLRPGDQVYLRMDGEPLNGGKPTGSQFVLSPVDRGTHVVEAVVRSSEGEMMCQTPGVTFHVHQPSLLNPANPLRRR